MTPVVVDSSVAAQGHRVTRRPRRLAVITLKRENDATDTILRSEIDELTSTGRSLMPEGLEKSISKQEMAGLLAFLAAQVGKYGPAADASRQRDFGTLPGLVEPGK
jgi:hypothetical protein